MLRGVGWKFVTDAQDNVGLIFKDQAMQEESSIWTAGPLTMGQMELPTYVAYHPRRPKTSKKEF
jgi:hypothetical protein